MMSEDTALKIAEGETGNSKTAVQIDVLDERPREVFELVDDPGCEEDVDGYGHGV